MWFFSMSKFPTLDFEVLEHSAKDTDSPMQEATSKNWVATHCTFLLEKVPIGRSLESRYQSNNYEEFVLCTPVKMCCFGV